MRQQHYLRIKHDRRMNEITRVALINGRLVAQIIYEIIKNDAS
mgnify:CR=1 FL=1